MKQEKLAFLADNPFYTKRFAVYVGKRCSTSTIKDVAKELHLDRKPVKELEKHYLREKLRRAGTPKPNVIGIDELSIRKGHTYRIVVSDLIRHRPIWYGGQDRSEKSLNSFYQRKVQYKSGRGICSGWSFQESLTAGMGWSNWQKPSTGIVWMRCSDQRTVLIMVDPE